MGSCCRKNAEKRRPAWGKADFEFCLSVSPISTPAIEDRSGERCRARLTSLSFIMPSDDDYSLVTMRNCSSQDQKTCHSTALAWLCSQAILTNYRLRTHPPRNACVAPTMASISHTRSAPSPHVSAHPRSPSSTCQMDGLDSTPSLSTGQRISCSKIPGDPIQTPQYTQQKRIQTSSAGASPLGSAISQTCNRLRICAHNRTCQPTWGGRPSITAFECRTRVSRQHS